MKLVELGTFAILVLFIGGMTLTNQERLAAEKQEVEKRKETIEFEKRVADIVARTAKETIPHDTNLDTKTIMATLDARDSFDAGNAAEFIKVKVKSYNEEKPICKKWNKECTEKRKAHYVYTPNLNNRSSNGLFEENKCECEEYETDECGDIIYEQECARHIENCEGEKNCPCDEFAWDTIDYVDACEYKKLNHDEKRQYVKDNMPQGAKLIENELKYLWEQQSGPTVNLDLFDHYKDKEVLVLELAQGEYVFSCTVTDTYGFDSYLEKRVSIAPEPNNNPEIHMKWGRPNKEQLAKFNEIKEKLEKAAKKK